MNNKLFKGLLLVMIVGFGLSACSKHTKTDNGQTSTREDTIVIGLDDNYPPIGFHNEQGEIVGSDVDLAKAAAKLLGKKVVFKPIDWSSKEVELKSGKIDAIWNGLTVTEERKKNILFTQPYEKQSEVIAVKKDSPITSIDGLKGKVVAIQSGSTAEDTLRKNPELEKGFKALKRYSDMSTIYLDLKLGRIDAAILDEPLARYYSKKSPGSFVILATPLSVEYDAVGVAKGNTALQKKLNVALKKMYDDGTTKAIFQKWFGHDISVPIK